MNQLNIHNEIKTKLEYFKKVHKIPNIIFHGPSGCGKRTLVHDFIKNIYDDNKERIKSFVMYVNCAHGKGIKFIRDELKFFAKTHIQSNGGDNFKSVILLNADKLTMDAQSALRRCIELFNHTTRFFIIVEDKYKLLKPVLSRFCEIYIPEPIHEGKNINLHKYNLTQSFPLKTYKKKRIDWLKKEVNKCNNETSPINLIDISTKIYEKGYCGLDISNLLENNNFTFINENMQYELLMIINKVKKDIKCEKILIYFILYFIFIGTDISLDNISFM